MDDLLSGFINTSESTDDIVCEWMMRNRPTWAPWIPDETQCVPGFGLHNGSSYVVSREDSVSCKACESGRYSAQLFDEKGYTHTCMQCPTGTSQPSGAAVSCEPCDLGEYQDAAGSKTCKRCSIGTYQDETGSTACKSCKNRTTTVGLASISAQECGCQPGYIDTSEDTSEDSNCRACQTGLHCPGLSTVQALSSGESILGQDFVPRILPGYMSLSTAGLDIYKCNTDTACPGGKPGSCLGDSRGVGCFECEADQWWNLGHC